MLLQCPTHLTVPTGSAMPRMDHHWRSNRLIKTTFLPTCLTTYLLETTWQNNLEIHFSLVSRNCTGFWLPLIMSHIYWSLCSLWGESPYDTSPKLCPGQSHKNSTICARHTTKTGNLPSVKDSYSLGDGVRSPRVLGKPKFNRSDSKRNCLEKTNCFNLLSSARMKPRTLSTLDKCSTQTALPSLFQLFKKWIFFSALFNLQSIILNFNLGLKSSSVVEHLPVICKVWVTLREKNNLNINPSALKGQLACFQLYSRLGMVA